MPFNGAGVYSAPGADFPAVTQTVISSTHYNNVINDIATGLSLCLTKDGQQVATANIPFGGFRATNVGITAIAGSVGTPAINVSDAGTGLYRSAASELAVTVAGTQRGRFDATGLIVTGTVNASTSVVTPLVSSAAALRLSSTIGSDVQTSPGGGTGWLFKDSSQNLFPNGDNDRDAGGPSNRIARVYTPIIDSGTTGSLSLKTNNGQTQVSIRDLGGNAANQIVLAGGISTLTVLVGADGTDSNIGMRLGSKGTGGFEFFSATTITNGALAAGSKQFEVLHTASSSRNITVTGSNGGNPTISTTAGSLAITPSVVIAGAAVSIGTNPALAAAGINLAYATSVINIRNSANNGDLGILSASTVNTVANVTTFGSNVGTLVSARSGGAAPTTSDLASGYFTVWRDTGGATTKLYYNNGGVIQSVALA